MQETWYVLKDGSSADPAEVITDENGVLRHKDGMAVAIGAHGNPRSRGVDAEAERKKAKKPKQKSSVSDRQMKAEQEDGAEYKTR